MCSNYAVSRSNRFVRRRYASLLLLMYLFKFLGWATIAVSIVLEIGLPILSFRGDIGSLLETLASAWPQLLFTLAALAFVFAYAELIKLGLDTSADIQLSTYFIEQIAENVDQLVHKNVVPPPIVRI